MNRLLHISIINDFSWIAVNIIEFLCLQYMGEVGANFEVYRNDDITVEEIKKLVNILVTC
jgi:hypothetical protein